MSIVLYSPSFDKNDTFWEKHQPILSKRIKQACQKKSVVIKKIKLVQCKHNGKPAWAQNDAMMEAYLDGMDYGYRINDDTLLQTTGWTEKFIGALESLDPPNIGVVGPTHSRGNMNILTYDFTSMKHIDIFGYHYPKLFTDWFAGNFNHIKWAERKSAKSGI